MPDACSRCAIKPVALEHPCVSARKQHAWYAGLEDCTSKTPRAWNPHWAPSESFAVQLVNLQCRSDHDVRRTLLAPLLISHSSRKVMTTIRSRVRTCWDKTQCAVWRSYAVREPRMGLKVANAGPQTPFGGEWPGKPEPASASLMSK